MKNPLRRLFKASRMVGRRQVAAALAVQRLSLLATQGSPATKRSKRSPKAKSTASILPPRRPAPGTFVDGQFHGLLRKLDYKLYTPKGSSRRKLPLMVMLHGCHQTAADFAVGTGMNQLADELGFLVLYPQQSLLANLNRCWNWHRPSDRARGRGEAALIAGLTRQITATSKANADRVYIAGISAGGILSGAIGSAYPEIYAAIGVHSGFVAGDIASLREALVTMRTGQPGVAKGKTKRPLPTIVFHGDLDKVVHPSNVASFADLLPLSGASAIVEPTRETGLRGGRTFVHSTYQSGTQAPVLEEWIIQGGGHAWSGGQAGGTFTDTSGPDASREMMRFFLARKRAAPATKLV